MLCAHANENTTDIRTVSARMKSPKHFYIYYKEFDRLQRDGGIISSDIHFFANIRLDEKRDRLAFEFTWLTGHCHVRVEGTEQAVDLRWSGFRDRRPVMHSGLILHNQDNMGKAHYSIHT